MGWARLDDNRHDHEKILLLGDGLDALAAVGLLDHALTWAHRHRNDSKTPGLVPWGFLRQRAGKHSDKLVRLLLDSSLVDADPDDRGVYIHNFADYLPKRDPDEAAAAGKRGADSRWGNHGSPDSNSHSNSHTDSHSNSHTDSQAAAMANDGSRVGAPASAPAFPSRPVPKSSTEDRAEAPKRVDVERLCAQLADLIEGNGSKRPPVTRTWRDAARLLLDTDKRSLDEASRLIDWCQRDDFWRGNVLSMPTFRKQYDRIRLKAGGAVRPAADRQTAWVRR